MNVNGVSLSRRGSVGIFTGIGDLSVISRGRESPSVEVVWRTVVELMELI